MPLSSVPLYPFANGSFFQSASSLLVYFVSSLSLTPNLHSGMPDSWVFTMTWPKTSAFRTVPLLESSTLTFSMMSIKTSFLLYLMPSARQEIAPVALTVIYLSFSISVSWVSPSTSQIWYTLWANQRLAIGGIRSPSLHQATHILWQNFALPSFHWSLPRNNFAQEE